MAPLTYLSFICISIWISFIKVVTSGANVGEFLGFALKMDSVEVLFLIVINSVVFVAFYFLYILSTKKKALVSINIKFQLMKSRLDLVFLLLLLSQLLFLIFTGVGRLLSDAIHPLSPLFSFFSPEAFLPIYYLLNRKKASGKGNKVFYLNILLFSVFKLLQGWSSFILVIFFLEFFYRTHCLKMKSKHVFISLLLPFVLFAVGGVIYAHVYQFKNEIRDTPVGNVSYSEGVTHLASRLSMAPVSIAAYDRMDTVVKIFNSSSSSMKEIIGLARPISPRVIMPNKEFRSLNNNVLEAYYPTITDKTSSNMGLFMYLRILVNADVSQAMLYVIITSFLLFFAKFFLDSIEQRPRQLQFVLFILLINVANISSLEVVFGYGFIKVLTVFTLCWLFGSFKIYYKNKNVQFFGMR